jgi:hypothetical protein
MINPSLIILLLRCRNRRLIKEMLIEQVHSGWVLPIVKEVTQELTGFLFS